MSAALIILAAVAAGLLVFYFFFAESFVAMAVGLMRRASRLKRKTVLVNDEPWPYLEGGPGHGQVLVLLHGFGGDKDNWTPYAYHFTKTYRVIAPDLPGFGENVRNPDRDYRASGQAKALGAFLDALDIGDGFHLAGNSMGGYITLQFALTHPDRLGSIALLNNAGVMSEKKTEFQQAMDRRENLFALSTMEDLDGLFDLVTYKPIFLPGAFKRVMLDRAIRDQPLHEKILWSLIEEIDTGAMNEQLPRVAVPTLVIWGRHDQLVDVSIVDVLAASVPDNHCVVMEETGHVPMLERPKETASHHIRFMKRLQSGASRSGPCT